MEFVSLRARCRDGPDVHVNQRLLTLSESAWAKGTTDWTRETDRGIG